MSGLPTPTEASDEDGERRRDARPPAMPTWVKVLGLIGLVLVAFLVFSTLAGAQHGPGLHAPAAAVEHLLAFSQQPLG